MAATAILNLAPFSILVTWPISVGDWLHYCKICSKPHRTSVYYVTLLLSKA